LRSAGHNTDELALALLITGGSKSFTVIFCWQVA